MKKQSIKTKFNLREIDLKLIFIGALILISFIAPYLHIFLPKESTVKVFGFRNLRTFMYSFGLPVSLFACSCILTYATSFINKDNFKKLFLITSLLFNYTSVFNFIWIFWASSDLSKLQYYISLALISLIFTYTYFLFYKKYTNYTNLLKNNIKTLFNFMFSLTTKNYIKEEKEEEFAIYRIEVTDSVIINEKD